MGLRLEVIIATDLKGEILLVVLNIMVCSWEDLAPRGCWLYMGVFLVLRTGVGGATGI